jgi:hypothetical protein
LWWAEAHPTLFENGLVYTNALELRSSEVPRSRDKLWDHRIRGVGIRINPPLLELLNVRLPQRLEDNISYIYFDYGLIMDLLVLALCAIGITQRRRNRWFGIAGVVLISLWWVAVLI